MEQLYLIAHIAGRAVAFRSEEVESVVDLAEITPVPRSVAVVRGLAALRSRVVTVIDTHLALGLNSTAVATRAVITVVDGHHYAMLVDALEDVVPLTMAPLASSIPLEAQWRAAALGIVEREQEPLLVISLHALVPQAALAA